MLQPAFFAQHVYHTTMPIKCQDGKLTKYFVNSLAVLRIDKCEFVRYNKTNLKRVR